jgi:hypothetical protein
MNKTESVMVGSINYETPVMVAREIAWLRAENRTLMSECDRLENEARHSEGKEAAQ